MIVDLTGYPEVQRNDYDTGRSNALIEKNNVRLPWVLRGEVPSKKMPLCIMRCANPHLQQRGQPKAYAAATTLESASQILKTQGILFLSLIKPLRV